MIASTDAIGLITAVFIAAAVEVVEAFTIVLAMGISRGWKSALSGAVAAVTVLAIVTGLAGFALYEYLNPSFLQFVIGTLLLIFGLQWLRKAMLRSAGLKAQHDEEQIFADEQAAAQHAGHVRHFGLDWFGFVVSFKGVFLEGLEVVFIVITFGIGATNRGVPDAMAIAAGGAVAAALLVLAAGAVIRRPLTMVPENTMKYAVALLLSSFGVFWAIEGIGFFGPTGESLRWSGGTWALVSIFLAWLVVSRITVAALRRIANSGERLRIDTGSGPAITS
ncbi:MAG: COG4280 domain-containing protein [Acidiferrobacterales bacterium]